MNRYAETYRLMTAENSGTYRRAEPYESMGRRTLVSLVRRQALNQALLAAGRVPVRAVLEPAECVRALRSALKMSQAQLSRRSGIAQPHIVLVESGKVGLQVETMRRLLDAMFCDLLILPRARKRPGDAIAERRVERPDWRGIWD
jgi:DNA-binding XRE family transcriptional regulator